MDKDRRVELINETADVLDFFIDGPFDYRKWDHLVEEGRVTDSELRWMRENLEVHVDVRLKVTEQVSGPQ